MPGAGAPRQAEHPPMMANVNAMRECERRLINVVCVCGRNPGKRMIADYIFWEGAEAPSYHCRCSYAAHTQPLPVPYASTYTYRSYRVHQSVPYAPHSGSDRLRTRAPIFLSLLSSTHARDRHAINHTISCMHLQSTSTAQDIPLHSNERTRVQTRVTRVRFGSRGSSPPLLQPPGCTTACRIARQRQCCEWCSASSRPDAG